MSTKTTLKIGLGVFAAAVMIGASQQMRSPVSAASQEVSTERARVMADAIALQAFSEPADHSALSDAQSSFVALRVALRVAHLDAQAAQADRRVEEALADALFAAPARLAVADTERVAAAVRAAEARWANLVVEEQLAATKRLEAERIAAEQRAAAEAAPIADAAVGGRPFGQGGNRFMCG